MENILENSLQNEKIHSKIGHIKDINPKALYLCSFDKCNKDFKDKKTRREHFKSHKGEKPFTW